MAYSEIELYEDRNTFLLVPVKRSRMNKDKVIQSSIYQNNYVVIDRKSGEMKKFEGEVPSALYAKMNAMTRILGVVGVLNLISGPYLIVILGATFIGNIKKHRVYKLSQIKTIPFKRGAYRLLNEDDKFREQEYIGMVSKILVGDNAIYYSYTCDLTLNFQKQSEILNTKNSELDFQSSLSSSLSSSFSETSTRTPNNLWKFSNERFFWNHHLSAPFRQANLDGYIIPMIRGYVDVLKTKIKGNQIVFGLISRVDSKRSGTRYNTRGADLQGNVANFVETEQFLMHDGLFTSFIIIRGSIPLLWTQFANPLKYNPEVKFEEDKSKQIHAYKKHMNFLHKDYSHNILAINLCKEKGQELLLSKFYKSLIDKVPLQYKVGYFPFDFHSETKGLKMERISILLTGIRKEMENFAYFLDQYDDSIFEVSKNLIKKFSNASTSSATTIQVSKQEVPKNINLFEDDLLDFQNTNSQDFEFNLQSVNNINDNFDIKENINNNEKKEKYSSELSKLPLITQKGVLRVNCIDCCDRTNVVQTAISRAILEEQFRLFGIFDKNDYIGDDENFYRKFQHFWANNGDRISSLYAGTGALMGDFTRTGQRSVVGLMKDGMNAVNRYVQNNFKDSAKLRSIYLVLGQLDIQSEEENWTF